MGDPINELHKSLVSQGLLDGAAANLDQFRTSMADPQNRRDIFDFISTNKKEMVDIPFDQFDKLYAPPAEVKKNDGGQPSSGGSSQTAVPAPAAGEPSPLDSITEPLGKPESPIPFAPGEMPPAPEKKPDIPAQLTGDEDPIAVGGNLRRRVEADYDFKDEKASKHTASQGVRDLEKITTYGQEALKQSENAAKVMEGRLGKDWQTELAKAANASQMTPQNSADIDYMGESRDFLNQVFADPDYLLWQNGQKALIKAQTEFNNYAKRNPDYARQLAEGKVAQKQADESLGMALGNWTDQKATQLVAGIASLPRTFVGAMSIPGAPKGPMGLAASKFAQDLGDWADHAVEWTTRTSPTGSDTKRALWETQAPFDGLNVTLDDKGNPVKVYDQNDKEVQVDDTFIKRFTESGAAAQAEKRFTGAKNSTMKLIDTVADIYIMRGMGGGSMAGTTGVAFALQHQDAYNTAVNDLKLTGDDASKYAMISSGLSAVIEASIGNIESKPLKLAAAKAVGLKEAKALVGKASMYDIAKAAWAPMVREVGMENVEELVDMGVQTLNNQMFNAITGSTLDTGIKADQVAETIIMTTLATSIAGGGDVVRQGRGEMHSTALNAAVQNPEAYIRVLEQLQAGGALDAEQVQAQTQRITRLAEINSRLPETITEEERQEVIALEDQRQQVAMQYAGSPSEAQQKVANETSKSIDQKIAKIIEKPAEDGDGTDFAEPEIPLPMEEGATVPVVENVGEGNAEPVNAPDTDPLIDVFSGNPDVNPFDAFPTEDRLGEDRIVSPEERAGMPVLSELADRNTPVTDVITAFGEDGRQALSDDATNLGLNSLLPTQRKKLMKSKGAVEGLRAYLDKRLTDPEWVKSRGGQSFQNQVEILTDEYTRANMKEKPETRLTRRLEPASVQDHIAIAFAEGVRIRPGDITGEVTDAKTNKPTQLQYTSRNGTPLDLLAQDIMERMGAEAGGGTMAENDVRNEILDFIHSNPEGPGNYMRDTIARREMSQEQAEMQDQNRVEDVEPYQAAVQVESNLNDTEVSELSDFIDSYGDNTDQLIEDWEQWDPFEPGQNNSAISNLSPNVFNQLDEQIQRIRSGQPVDQKTGKVVRTRQSEVLQTTTSEEQPNQDPGTIEPAGVEEKPVTRKEAGQLAGAVDVAITPDEIDTLEMAVDEALERAELPDALTLGLLFELHVDGHITATEHNEARQFLSGNERPEFKAAYDKALAAIPNLRTVVSEGPAPYERLPQDGNEVVPVARVSTLADGTHLVENAAAFADLLSAAGGTYDVALGGWVFPSDARPAIDEALSTRRTDGGPVRTEVQHETQSASGLPGLVSSILTSPGATLKRYRTKTRLKAANSLDERLAVAQALHNITRGRDQRAVRRSLKRLQAAFPNIEVVTDTDSIDAAKRKLGVTNDILGFTHEGKVYVDPRVARPDTPIHEFGHIWNTWLKENNPTMYKQGIDLAMESPMYAQVQQNPRYANLTPEQQAEETLAVAIGERGALMGSTDIVLRFRQWLGNMWNSVRETFGFDPKFMTLQEFADYQASTLLSGSEVMTETSRRIKALEAQMDSFKAQFGGEKGARGAMVDRLDTAWQMEEQGTDDEKIFYATGWYRGVDGHWRWGIDSETMTVKVDNAAALPENPTLADLVDYPALFEAYPDLGAIPVSLVEGDSDSAVLNAGGKQTLELNPATVGNQGLPSLIIHEIQHLIQNIEGFARGSGWRMMGMAMQNEQSDIQQSVIENLDIDDPELEASLRARQARVDKYTTDPRALFQAYLDTAGEVEARAAERYWEERRADGRPYPPNLYEVAPEEQLVVFMTDEKDGEGTPRLMPPARFSVGTTAADYSARMTSARQVIALEIQTSGLREIDANAKKVAQALNLDLEHVKRIYEEEINKAGAGRVVLTPNDLNAPAATTKEKFMAAAARSQGKGKAWIKKKFNTNKGLGTGIFRVDEKRLGQIAARLKSGAYLQSDLEVAMNKAYGNPTPTQWRHVDNVMRGEGDWGTLPAGVRAAAENMRSFADGVSRDLVRAGVMNGEVIITVLQNSGIDITQKELENYSGVNVYKALGKLPFERSAEENAGIEHLLNDRARELGRYFYRSYKLHDAKDWTDYKASVDPRTMAEARRELEAMIGRDIAALEEARTDKIDVLEGQVMDIQDEINKMLDDLQVQQDIMAKRVTDLEEKQDVYVADKGVRNQNIDRSYAAATRALRELQKRARAAQNVSVDDAAALLALSDPAFQQMAVAVKQIVRRRRDIMAIRERQERALNYRQADMDEMQNRLQNIDGVIDEILFFDKGAASQLSVSKLGAKDLKVLKARKDIPQAIRDLMGEYHDPRINFAKSMFRAVTLLENQKFLTELRQNFAGIHFIPPTETKAGYVPISSEGSNTLSPLNGWKTTPEILQALNEYFGPKSRATDLNGKIYEGYIKTVSAVKYGKTILSLDTHARNFFGNMFFMINNVYDPLTTKTLLAFKDVWTNIKSQEQRDYMIRLTELRVIGNSSHLGSLKDLINEVNADDTPGFLENKLLNRGNKIRKGIEETYGAEDDFFKIMAFETEKSRYAKALYGTTFDNLSASEKNVTEQKAAGIVTSTLPTYSMVPQIVRDLNRFPLTGTFVAFSAEMFRVTWNQYALIGSDLADPRTRGIGVRRMIGAAVAQGGMAAGLTALGHWISGIDWEEDKAARRFMFPWQKYGAIMYKNFEPGKELTFINTSYTNPYAYQTKPLAALFLNWGKTGTERMQEAAWTLFEPFLSSELTANTLGQLHYNLNERTGKHIYNPLRGPFGDFGNTMVFMGQNLQPGISKKFVDLYSAITEESIGGRTPKRVSDVLLGTFGLQIERMNLEKVVSSNIHAKSKDKTDARAIFNVGRYDIDKQIADIKKKGEDTTDAQAELQSLYDLTTMEYNGVLKDVGVSAQAAKVLGVEPKAVQSTMKDQGFSEAERVGITNGTKVLPKFDGFNK